MKRHTAYTVAAACIAVIIAIAALEILSGFGLWPPQSYSKDPTGFQYAAVMGGPDNGSYTVAFSLQDSSLNNAAAEGTLTLKIVDSRGQLLYNGSKAIWRSDFRDAQNASLGKTIQVCSWQLNSSDVSPGVPFNSTGKGLATMTFTNVNGTQLVAGNILMSILALPRVNVTGVSFQTNSPTPIELTPLNGFPLSAYAGDTITMEFNVSALTPISIFNISSSNGFSFLSVSPSLPLALNSNKTPIEINFSATSLAYEGNLGLFFYRYDCHCTPEPSGEIILDGYAFNSTGGLDAYVRNSGLIPVTINSTYIDGTKAGYEPIGASIEKGDTIILHINAGIMDSMMHSLRIVCADGTELTANVKKI
ncbi:MAG: hypothetical protein LUP94_00100 [Candidatus Methanomethylicus sp.]|nr:hypothetical protein [Candidatus Methanomethylicus sp.]